jgi:hypothetical protein
MFAVLDVLVSVFSLKFSGCEGAVYQDFLGDSNSNVRVFPGKNLLYR